ncbi:TetR family transcriptional regulator [Streptomyces sp. WAC 01529]|uniref:TetR/AcrR family transcriptional regulator n=1 Tax=Streptomyces sp. WAC 01529 TaxID=2203205 RepID=UPI000F6FF657|nr:TetR/AcrR family transcriptional regulator [Streptomyces sp. WAC 01529]AZM54229.1 TetR family transcriptional regulator [Streptomyces sp. WAC 01529]
MAKAAGRTNNPARTSVWLQGKAPRGGGRKGDQPSGLDRDRITEVSVRLLDAEGLAKFSMRRLAAELNVTAMSVYWYVDTKDDLLELALDAVCGEMRLPGKEEPAEAWRDQLRSLADEYRALLIRHPWVSPLVGRFLNIGPHWLEFALAVQRAVGHTGLPVEKRNGAISAVFQFVYGFGTIEGHYAARCAEAGMTQDEYYREATGKVQVELASHEIMESAGELMAARGGGTVEEMWERDFTIALDLMIAGIESLLVGG